MKRSLDGRNISQEEIDDHDPLQTQQQQQQQQQQDETEQQQQLEQQTGQPQIRFLSANVLQHLQQQQDVQQQNTTTTTATSYYFAAIAKFCAFTDSTITA